MPESDRSPDPLYASHDTAESPPSSEYIVISFLSEPDVESAALLYTEVFLHDEPTSVRIAPDPARLLTHARWYVNSLVGREFSTIARDTGTGDLIGFMFCFDLTDNFGDDAARFKEYLANFREAIVMIDELEMRFLNRSSISPGSVLHALQAGVSRKYRGRGVLKAMMGLLIHRARERGYRQIVAECTNPLSIMALEQHGFQKAGYLEYDSFFIDGVRFFEGLEGDLSLMVLDL